MSEREPLTVLVMAPILGRDLAYLRRLAPRLRVLDGHDAYHADLHEQGLAREPLVPGAPVPSREERDALLARADVLVIGSPVPKDLVARAPRLVWAHHTQAGVSNLYPTDLWSSDITLTSSRGWVGASGIAEYVIAAAFYFGRGLHDANRQRREGAFTRSGYRMARLQGATMGVIGLGGIGREVARLARAVGMRVVATRRSVTAPDTTDADADLVLPSDGLLDLAAQSDFLAVCSQLTPETHHLVDERVLAVVKPTAVLVNIARGEEVDEVALVEAIRSGRLRGAVLDVYEGERTGSPPRPELLALPEVLLTPHLSGGGDTQFAEPMRVLAARNLERYLDGRPLENVVDRARGY